MSHDDSVKWWVTEKQFYNSVMEDHLIDFLVQEYKRLGPDFVPAFDKPGYDCKLDFPRFIDGKQKTFQEKWLKFLHTKIILSQQYLQDNKNQKWKSPLVSVRSDGTECVLPKHFSITLHLLKVVQPPAIAFGCLQCKKNKVYSFPDLLIRRDYLKYLYTIEPPDLSPLVTNGSVSYVVVTAKFSRLKLNKHHILHSRANQLYYQVCCAFQTLVLRACTFSFLAESPFALVTGRSYEVEGKLHNSPLSTCGYVSIPCSASNGFKGEDILCASQDAAIPVEWSKYLVSLFESIRWRRQLKTQGATWQLTPKPSYHLLWPNMKVQSNYPWAKIKKDLAKKLGELTLIWRVSKRDRLNLHALGIFDFHDPQFRVEQLNIKNPHFIKIIESIVEINRDPNFKEAKQEQVVKKRCCSPYMLELKQHVEWLEPPPRRVEFFVDFETTSSISEKEIGCIAMIGCAARFVDSKEDQPFDCKIWTVNRLDDPQSEMRIITNWMDWVREKFGVFEENIKPRMWHWSPAETVMLTQALTLENRCQALFKEQSHVNPLKQFEWCDMRKLFADNAVAIKGCFDYSLKSVAKALHKLGKIPISWPESQIDSGLSAMIALIRADEIAAKEGKTLSCVASYINEIMEYNSVDVQAMAHLLDFLKAESKTVASLIISTDILPLLKKK